MNGIGIAGRIWLCVALLVGGYALTTGIATWVGQENEQQARLAAEQTRQAELRVNAAKAALYPAAILSFKVRNAFKALIRSTQNAMGYGEIEKIEQALETHTAITASLNEINRLLNAETTAANIQVDLDNFIEEAMPTYRAIADGEESDAVMAKAGKLAERIEGLASAIDTLANASENTLKTELAQIAVSTGAIASNTNSIADETKKQWVLGLVIFVIVLIISVIIVGIIILNLVHEIRRTASGIKVGTYAISRSGAAVLHCTDELQNSANNAASSVNQMNGRLQDAVQLTQTNTKQAREADNQARVASQIARGGLITSTS